MFKYIKQYRFYITLFLFVLIPIIAIDTSTRSPAQYRFYDKVIVTLTSPFQNLITWSLDSVISGFHHYFWILKIRDDNRSLLDENRKLLMTIVNLKETEQENQRLRKLLHFKEEFRLKTVVARVIARDVSNEFRAIRLNRGESAGIHKNMAVINSDGVIGRVWRTTKGTADVVTILDLLSAIDSVISRSRARGIVEGLNDELCHLKFALRTDDIQQGDLLVTSGLGGVFPKGIPVGMVSKVVKKPFGITQTVEVRPTVDFSRLEEVLVVTEFDHSPLHVSEASDLTSTVLSSKAPPPPAASPESKPRETGSSPSPEATPEERENP